MLSSGTLYFITIKTAIRLIAKASGSRQILCTTNANLVMSTTLVFIMDGEKK